MNSRSTSHDRQSRSSEEAGGISRRRFLGAITALAAAAAIRDRLSDPDTAVFALGGAGARVAERMMRDHRQPRYWLWNRMGQGHAATETRKPYGIEVPDALLAGGAGSARSRWVQARLHNLGSPRRVAVVAGLGGLTGSNLVPETARALLDTGNCTDVFCTVPFRFEGAARRSVADEAVERLAALGIVPWIVRLDELRPGSRGQTLAAALAAADERLARRMRRFLAAH